MQDDLNNIEAPLSHNVSLNWNDEGALVHPKSNHILKITTITVTATITMSAFHLKCIYHCSPVFNRIAVDTLLSTTIRILC